MIKNKLFKYFFIEFLKIFLIISFSFSILIWISQASRLLDLITEYGNSITVYTQYVLLIFPKVYENTFLLNFIISIFFTFSKLESSNEISIYWLSGIAKNKMIKLIILIASLLFLINMILSVYLAPLSSFKSRTILANSKFDLINSLVKENNFNSPFRDMTIFVKSNDKKGNLEGIFIYEKTQTVIAKLGTVYKENDSFFLELKNGITQEKNGNKINTIKFEKTIFDFSKYNMQNIKDPKFSEMNIQLIFNMLVAGDSKKLDDIRKEFNKRTIKPFSIFLLATLGCFLIYDNREKINLKKFRLILFFSSILFLILNEILINISSKSIYHSFGYFFILIFFELIFLLTLVKTLKNESMGKK